MPYDNFLKIFFEININVCRAFLAFYLLLKYSRFLPVSVPSFGDKIFLVKPKKCPGDGTSTTRESLSSESQVGPVTFFFVRSVENKNASSQ